MLSLSTFNIDLIFDPSKSSYNNKLGTVMAIKPVTEELILIAYESGQLLLWDMKKNNVLSSLVIEEYPMTFDFDVSLMQGIVGSASNKLEVNKIPIIFKALIIMNIINVIKLQIYRFSVFHQIIVYLINLLNI